MSSTLTARIYHGGRILAEGLRVGFILFLTVLISGLLPMLVQTYGWYDMAQKAGGMENLVEVVTEAPPCKFCKAASVLQKKSEPDQKAPANSDRVEILKTYAVFSALELLRTEKAQAAASRVRRPIFNEVFPRNLLVAPETPPPELTV